MKKVVYKVLCVILFLAIFSGTAPAVFAVGYSDVPVNAWCYKTVNYVTKSGLMSGTGNSAFSPDRSMSRGMLMAVLYRMEDSPMVHESKAFSDVASGTYYEDAISWAVQKNIVSGIGGDQFSPETPITRQQLATILYRYAQSKGYDTALAQALTDFSDAGKVGSYATEALRWTVANQIIQGSDGKLNPGGNATRAQAATMLVRFIENVRESKKSDTLEPGYNIGYSIIVTIDNKTFTATLEDNDTTKAFIKKLPLTIDMSELNGTEKYYYLSNNLRADEAVRPYKINKGDLMLYGDNCLALFYETFDSSYSYVKLGHIDDTSGFENTLGKSNVQVKFSVSE